MNSTLASLPTQLHTLVVLATRYQVMHATLLLAT